MAFVEEYFVAIEARMMPLFSLRRRDGGGRRLTGFNSRTKPPR